MAKFHPGSSIYTNTISAINKT